MSIDAVLGPTPLATKEVVFHHLFGSISKIELRAHLGGFRQAKEIWDKVAASGYIMKNCKLFAWAKHLDPTIRRTEFSISVKDARFLSTIDLRSVRRSARSYTLPEFSELEQRCLLSPQMRVHIGKFVSRKLIFLHRFYGLPREEIHNHLLCSGLYALRKQYPFYDSELHAQNIVKTAIHNAGMGLIEFWTRDKRNAIRDGHGVGVPIDSLRDVGVAPAHEDELRVNLQSLVKITNALPEAHQRFLSAAAGLPDLGLSLYLGLDNVQAAESSPYDRYLASLRDYYGLSDADQTALLSGLRSQLVG